VLYYDSEVGLIKVEQDGNVTYTLKLIR